MSVRTYVRVSVLLGMLCWMATLGIPDDVSVHLSSLLVEHLKSAHFLASVHLNDAPSISFVNYQNYQLSRNDVCHIHLEKEKSKLRERERERERERTASSSSPSFSLL